MRKGQSISINTIIIAAIALIVMIFLVMIFTGNMVKWRENSNNCISFGGECKNECKEDEKDMTSLYTCPENFKCCIKDYSKYENPTERVEDPVQAGGVI